MLVNSICIAPLNTVHSISDALKMYLIHWIFFFSLEKEKKDKQFCHVCLLNQKALVFKSAALFIVAANYINGQLLVMHT